MKKKIIYSMLILFSISITTFMGCQKEEDDSSNKLDDKSVYLDLPSNTNLKKLTKDNLEIISLAFFRLNIQENEDGLLKIMQNNGKCINISTNIFCYLQHIVGNYNKQILSEIKFTRNILQTRNEIQNSNTDCVARSLAYATGISYEQIDSWITSTYGNNGVPSDQFYNTMNHFCDNGAQVSLPMFNNMDISFNNSNKYIIVIGATHAVNIVAKNGSNIIYHDAQTGQTGICTTPYITHIYEIR